MTILKKTFSVLSATVVAALLLTVYNGCEDAKDVIIPQETKDTTIALDNFKINQNDTNYTIQSSLGAALGAKINPDTISHGGGQWYAYASGSEDGDSACVYSFDENGDPDTIVSLKDMKPEDAEVDPLKMFGDDSLTVVLDAKDAAADNEKDSYYYAAIGCALVGDPEHLDNVTGVKKITATDTGANSSVETVTWNLSNLSSITIKGKVTGAFTFNFNGVTADNNIGVALVKLSSPDPANETTLQEFNKTISVSELGAAGWNGAKWNDIKAQVHEIAIELNTDAEAGGDFVSMKLAEINLNFNSEENKVDAFPFLVK